jgi:hypothetical protein
MWMGLCLVSSVLALAGCGKDAEFEAFIKENDDLAKSIHDAKSGDEAKKIWDDKKAGMKTKYDAIKDARGFQVKEETQKKFTDSIMNAAKEVCDPTAGGFNADVCKDYGDTLTAGAK